jgi:hypothetical protein
MTVQELGSDDKAFNAEVFTQLERAQVIFEHWRSYLSRKYGLNERDQFTRDGLIVRGEAEASSAVAPAPTVVQ